MTASPKTGYDLSRLDSWHGLRPGMTRSEVMAAIEKAGVRISTKEDEPDWLRAEGDWGVEVRFGSGEGSETEERVLQISVEDEESYRWNGKKVMDTPMHVALEILRKVADGAGWRPEDAVCTPSEDETARAKPATYSDEFLLSEGTLWLPGVGVGLVMADGSVSDVVWRRAEDVPRPLVSAVTEAQMQLSRRSDLSEHLLEAWKQRTLPGPPTAKRNAMEMALAVLLVLALAYIGWRAWEEMMSWQQAANLPGKVLNIETKPGKLVEKVYHVEFADPSGRYQQVALERADFYVAPREIGEEVIVCYVQNEPPRVRGPARAKDAAFLTYLPWAMGVLLAYSLVKLALVSFPMKRRDGRDAVPLK